MSANMTELENQIGYLPRNKDHDLIMARVVRDTTKRQLLIAWCILNGIPTKSANAAQPMTLAKAYAISAYLSKWRSQANPGFSALHDTGDDDGEHDPFGDNQAPPPQKMELPADAADRLASSVAPLIRKLVTGEVEEQLKDRKLELSEASKQKIRDIAKESGESQAEIAWLDVKDWVKNELDKRIPPQEIVVKNVEAGTSVSIGAQHFQFTKLLRACQMRNHQGHRPNIWLTGPTGSGKTTAAENVSKALGLNFGADSSLDADYKVYGFYNAQGIYVRTTFREIFENGGVYVADEIDNWNQSALVALNAPLANGFGSFPDGMIKRHPDCVVIACANTWGLGATTEYVGRSKLDAASLDRFQPKLDWPTDEKLEMAIASKMDGMFGAVWCELTQAARANAKRQGLKVIISQRSTINGIAALQAGFSVEEAIEQTFTAGLAAEQIRSLGLSDLTYKVTRAMQYAKDAVTEEAALPTKSGDVAWDAPGAGEYDNNEDDGLDAFDNQNRAECAA